MIIETCQKSLPTFLGVGSQNCGTTWMSACIAQHPDVFIPEQKELSFFDVQYELGWQWYCRQFATPEKFTTMGEWSPGYICNKQAFDRVVKHLPCVRILALFRNPMDRLFSHYWRYRSQGATHLPLEKEILNNVRYIQMSLYSSDWRKWLNYYGQERCHAIIFDELIDNPTDCFKKVFSFLEIDSSFMPNIEVANRRQNAIHLNRYQWIMDFVAQSRVFLRRGSLSPLIDLLKFLGVREILKSFATAKQSGYGGGAALSDEMRLMLYEQYFKADIEKLQQLLPDRDLSKWIPVCR